MTGWKNQLNIKKSIVSYSDYGRPGSPGRSDRSLYRSVEHGARTHTAKDKWKHFARDRHSMEISSENSSVFLI